jgi:hypothetical protein
MKKFVIALVIISVLCIVGFLQAVQYGFSNRNGVSVRVKESDDTYRLYARYASYKAERVHQYLRKELKNELFRKRRVDADLTLEDRTHFHIKISPGKLLIQFNKTENDYDSYFRIKQLGEGIKRRLTVD